MAPGDDGTTLFGTSSLFCCLPRPLPFLAVGSAVSFVLLFGSLRPSFGSILVPQGPSRARNIVIYNEQ